MIRRRKILTKFGRVQENLIKEKTKRGEVKFNPVVTGKNGDKEAHAILIYETLRRPPPPPSPRRVPPSATSSRLRLAAHLHITMADSLIDPLSM